MTTNDDDRPKSEVSRKLLYMMLVEKKSHLQHFRLKQFLLNLESIKFLLFYNVYLISGLLNGITLRYFLQPGNRKYTL